MKKLFGNRSKKKETPDNVTFLEDGLTEVPSERRQKKRRRQIRGLAVLGALGLVIVTALCVTAAAGWLSVERISLSLYDSGRGKSAEENLPIAVNGLKVSDTDTIGYCFGLLDDRKYTIYSPACNLLYTYPHSMSAPVTVTSDRRVLLYERGNFTATVFDRKGVKWSKTMDKEILAADMNRKHRVIVATGSERYLSEVTLFDKNGKELQTWYSAERYAVDVAVSPDGKSFAVASVKVVNGEEQATVSLFRVGDDGPAEEHTFVGETVFDLRYWEDGTLMAVGTSTCSFFGKGRKMIGSYAYGNRTLSHFTNTDTHAVLLFAPEAGQTESTLLRVNEQGEEAGQTSVKEPDLLLAGKDGCLYIGYEDRVETVHFEGETVKRETLTVEKEQGQIIGLLPADTQLYILSINGLYAAE